ncbi:hypothetical protein F511_44404 [Dorcoceras hygrometricum]|uniref:Uncharacterized protein n=1 Tax=Dorcoceras hygrometricum TaxID=472368 RepID=A0A2Z7CWK7_9LAMI|nr:hypothetical protein F511_44404 [Dorcoceras hygrometricum]
MVRRRRSNKLERIVLIVTLVAAAGSDGDLVSLRESVTSSWKAAPSFYLVGTVSFDVPLQMQQLVVAADSVGSKSWYQLKLVSSENRDLLLYIRLNSNTCNLATVIRIRFSKLRWNPYDKVSALIFEAVQNRARRRYNLT